MHSMHKTTPKVETSAQVSSCLLKFVHEMTIHFLNGIRTNAGMAKRVWHKVCQLEWLFVFQTTVIGTNVEAQNNKNNYKVRLSFHFLIRIGINVVGV